MCKFSSKSGGVPFQILSFLGDLTRNDPKKSESSLLNMSFSIEYSCHTITNIKHGRRLSLQLMTN